MAHWKRAECLGKENDGHKACYLSVLSWKAFSVVDALWWRFIWKRRVLTSCACSEISLFCLFITTFQCCSFQIPDHPANSLVATYKSMQICTYDHLFPDRVENQIHHSTLLTLKDFPSVLSLRPSISGVLTVQISILIWCQHFKHNHLETRPIIFPPPLSGHKKLPQRDISANWGRDSLKQDLVPKSQRLVLIQPTWSLDLLKPTQEATAGLLHQREYLNVLTEVIHAYICVWFISNTSHVTLRHLLIYCSCIWPSVGLAGQITFSVD